LALRVRAEGPVKLVTDTHIPIRLTLDDARFSFRQFKFWIFLDRDAAGPVLVKLEARQRHHTEDWERHLDTSGAIVLQEALEPVGWQVVKATQLFDIAYGQGFRGGFPRIALGAVATSLTAMYLPLGILAVGWVQRRRA
jgi:hypothetical protein